MIRVVSGFSPSGYIEYGRTFLTTFDRYWPSNIDLHVYTEEPVEVPRGVQCRSLWHSCRGVADFIARHKDDPEKCGAKQNALWKPRYHGKPYCYRFDAVKFCKQMFIPSHAVSEMRDGEIMVWLDADVVTFDHVPFGFVQGLLGQNDVVYLGREGTHSEIGFWALRVNAFTRRFVNELADLYRDDTVFGLPEWHSAFVFDHVLSRFKLRDQNLTPGGRGHVWLQSPLSKYTDHVKGNRKALGYSPERMRNK